MWREKENLEVHTALPGQLKLAAKPTWQLLSFFQTKDIGELKRLIFYWQFYGKESNTNSTLMWIQTQLNIIMKLLQNFWKPYGWNAILCLIPQSFFFFLLAPVLRINLCHLSRCLSPNQHIYLHRKIPIFLSIPLNDAGGTEFYIYGQDFWYKTHMWNSNALVSMHLQA